MFAVLDDNSSNRPEASQPRDSHHDPSNTQAQDDLADEKSEQPRTLIETITHWLWGGVALPPAPPEQPAGDDEQIVHDEAAEEPFVRVEHGQLARPAANGGGMAGQDPEVVAAAIQAGIDPNEAEFVDDIEDLEGILELVGMQGPLAGLIQNGMFCAVLVSLTILFGVWIPYISGKSVPGYPDPSCLFAAEASPAMGRIKRRHDHRLLHFHRWMRILLDRYHDQSAVHSCRMDDNSTR